jgi:uncharacterized protein YjbI with pentapeptide repeats
MADQQLDTASLVSRIEQLEQQQIALKKYVTGLKRQIDDLTDKFSTRLNNTQTTKALETNMNGKSEPLDEIERINRALESLDQKIQAAPHQTPLVESSKLLVQQPTNSMVVAQEESVQLEDADDSAEAIQEPAISAEEFLKRYEEGERDFIGINLAGINLSRQYLTKDYACNLTQSNLSGANLRNFCFSRQNLSEANLKGAELCEAELTGTQIENTNLENANLYKAKLGNSKLGKANLKKANLSEAYLKCADLSGADLSESDLFKVNME